MCGHAGIVHGGLIGALFDDFFGTLFLLNAGGRYSGFTANLTIDYRTPLPASTTVAIVVWLDGVQGRKVYLRAEARGVEPAAAAANTVGDDSNSKDNNDACPLALRGSGDGALAARSGTGDDVGARWAAPGAVKYAEARGLFVVPKPLYDRVVARGETL
ncbi:HotDog domain-containing protein [Zopfochytrium polystomum]|nr:HotDog domain-containing protein [Zopfochytrium polystomum]